jgi:hypothetical protein
MPPEPATPEPAAPPAQETPPDTAPEVEETDWKAEARKWEQRAKENKSAADRLAELEDANKSEIQKASDKATAAEKAAAEAKAEALRWKVAAKHGITEEDADLFLTGTDEETLTKQAQRLTERVADRKKNGNHVPREGSTTTKPKEDEMREFTRRLFSSATSGD